MRIWILTVCALLMAAAGSLGHEFDVVADAKEKDRAVTFSKDVAPIFFNKCVGCHRPGEAAPMSLMTYKEARPWARSIKEKVLSRTMPPWHADPAYGKFANDRRLSSQEIETITSWVDGGALEGKLDDLPRAPSFIKGWKIGQPDVVFTMPVKFDVPAEGVLDYKYFTIPTNFKEDRWVQAAEVRPGNASVVHHVIVFVKEPRLQSNQSRDGEGDLEALTGVAPGQEPMILPDGVGALIKAGSLLILQMHYTPNGVAQNDQTSVGLIFSRKPVVKTAMGGAAMNTGFAIPAGDANFEVRAGYRIESDCHITSLMPHMHVRGKDFQYRLIFPDGASRIILSVPGYDFNWQTSYEFAEPIAAPAGSRIECVAHFDNSRGNKFNPDPNKLVRWGPQTWDEMMIGFIDYTIDSEKSPSAGQIPKQGSTNSQQSAARNSDKEAARKDPVALSPPDLDRILDRYVAAIGGQTAIRAQKSLVMKGTLRVEALGADGTIEVYSKAPNKELVELRSPMLGSSRTGFNGTSAWEEDDDGTRELKTYPKREADFYLPVKLRELYPKIEVKRREKVGSREAFLLEAPRGGAPMRWYFDVETGLLLRTEACDTMGNIVRSESYDDYRSVDGVRLPFTVTRTEEDGIEVTIKFTDVRHNVAIDDSKFEKPAAK